MMIFNILKNINRKLLLLILFVSSFTLGCGDDKKKGNNKWTPPPSNIRKKKKKKMRAKPANINLFANEKLDIPPFNEAAQNIPPELFTEKGKDQRDPFRNFESGDILTDLSNSTNNMAIEVEDDSIVLFQQYSLSELKLRGIVWSAGREKALFSNPNGQPTVVLKDDRISKSSALVKVITHDKVIVELKSKKGEKPKTIEYSLVRSAGPYQIQYDKLRADQRGIRVRLNRRHSRKRRSHD